MNSYKFAAAVYRVSGRVDYVDQAIRTYRGCVSYDAETGETIMHMAVRSGDVATIQLILNKLPFAALSYNKDGTRAISYVTDLINNYTDGGQVASRAAMRVANDILYRMVRSIVSADMPRRCYALEICICSAIVYVNEVWTRTASTAIITQALIDYAPEYKLSSQATADERDLGIALHVYTKPEWAYDVKNRKVRAMLTPDICDHSKLVRLPFNAKNKNESPACIRAKAAAAAVLDDDEIVPNGRLLNVYGSDPIMRAWNYTHELRWGELADIMESDAEIPRSYDESWIIVTVCQNCRPPESVRILRAALHRWPQLNARELSSWITRRDEVEIDLLLEIAPRQPCIRDIFEWAEYEICAAICREHWETSRPHYMRLEALQQLYINCASA